jgi:AraC-like DNA-binding protein
MSWSPETVSRMKSKLDACAYHFLLVGADLPIAACILQASRAAPYLSLSLELDQAVVCEVAAQVPVQRTNGTISALAVSAVDPPLLDAVTRLVAMLANDAAERRVLAPLTVREIVFRLLTGSQGARLRQLAVGEGSAHRVLKTLRWLQEHFAEPLRIEDLARDVQLSSSALHQHFKNVTAMSPLQYQKQLRLHEARRLMLTLGIEASEASFQVGYESPSQFSREYRRMFGAPPRRDIAHARGGVPVPAE